MIFWSLLLYSRGLNHFLSLPVDSFRNLIDINFRRLRVLLSLTCLSLSFLDIQIGLRYELKHRLLLQSDRLLQVFEKVHIFLIFLFLCLIFLDYTSLDLLDLLVIISEFRLQCFHLVCNKAKTILKLLLHQSHMSFHHISHKLSVNKSLIGLRSWLGLHLRHK